MTYRIGVILIMRLAIIECFSLRRFMALLFFLCTHLRELQEVLFDTE